MNPGPQGKAASWARARFHLRRLSVNTILQTASQILPLLAGAAAIPIVYRNIGAESFGIFTIGLSALGFFTVLDLGLGRAAVRFMARAFAGGDTRRAASIVVQSTLLLGGFSILLCLLLVVLAPTISVRWIQASADQHSLLRQCIYILAVAVPAAGLTSVFRSVLEAREDFLTISIVQAVLGTTTYLVPLVLSSITTDVRLILVGAVACRLGAFVAFLALGVRAWQGRFPWRSLDLRAETEFRQFSFWTIVSNVLGTAMVYADRGLLVRMFGLAEIAFYNVPVELLSRFMILVNSGVTVVFPSLARAAGNKSLFEGLFSALVTLLSVMIAIAFLALSIFTPQLLGVWLGPEFRAKSTIVVQCILIGMQFQVLNVVVLAALNARGFARPITIMHIIEAPLYLAALYFAGARLGLTGVALIWSARLGVEYVCFTAFRLAVSESVGRGRQLTGALLAAVGALPAVLLVVFGSVRSAVAACAVCVIAATAWSLRELRHAVRA